MTDAFRLPAFRESTTGRKMQLRSGYYTVISERDGQHTRVANWPDLVSARRCAKGLVGISAGGSMLVVKPAGMLDDDDFMERYTHD